MMAREKRPSSLYLDLKELKEKFDEADSEGKGYIDRDGLQRMTEGFDIDQLMLSLDRDKDGKVKRLVLNCSSGQCVQLFKSICR